MESGGTTILRMLGDNEASLHNKRALPCMHYSLYLILLTGRVHAVVAVVAGTRRRLWHIWRRCGWLKCVEN